MKKILSASLVAALAVCVAQPAFAQSSGVITINGEIVDSTCTVSVNGAGASPTITLPTVDVDELAAANDNTGWTAINFQLADCTAIAGFTQVVPFLQPSSVASINPTSGRLRNLTGTATNVEVGLSNVGGLGGAIDANATSGNQNISPLTITDNPLFTIYAGYVATGAATPGTVDAQVAYTLDYL